MKTTTSSRIVKVLVIAGLLAGISFLFVSNEGGNSVSHAGMGGVAAAAALFVWAIKKVA